MPVFEVIVMERPTPMDKLETGRSGRIVMQPTTVLAFDKLSAVAVAVLGKSIEVDVDRMQVAIREFADVMAPVDEPPKTDR